MTSAIKNYNIYCPPEGSCEKQITDEIHSKYIKNCIDGLLEENMIFVHHQIIQRPFSELSDTAQKYLSSKGCSNEYTVRVPLNMEDTMHKIIDALPKKLYWECLYSEIDESIHSKTFQGYVFTYLKPAKIDYVFERSMPNQTRQLPYRKNFYRQN